MIAKYIKRPVVIEAVKWTGDNYAEIIGFCGVCGVANYKMTGGSADSSGVHIDIDKERLEIQTLEGTMEASIGDFIIKGVKGEFYPCKPDIFEQTYELAKEGNRNG